MSFCYFTISRYKAWTTPIYITFFSLYKYWILN